MVSTRHMTIVVVDDEAETAASLLALLQALNLSGVRVPSAAAVQEVVGHQPAAVLVAIGLRSTPFELCQQIGQQLVGCPVLLYGVAPTADTLKKAMAAGVQRFLSLPLTAQELAQALRETHLYAPTAAYEASPTSAASEATAAHLPPPGQRIVTCFSPKGGVGCTMVAVNLAVALQLRGRRVALLDGSLTSGTLDTFMGLAPTNAMLHLVHDRPEISEFTVQQALVRHSSGVQVLLAPREPEQGETITAAHLQLMLKALRSLYDIVVVDTATGYDERMLLLLDSADRIVVPVSPDIAACKNLASFLRLSRLLGHPPEKLILVLVRADSVPPDQIKQIERFLGQPFSHLVPSDGRAATSALNDGVPVVSRHPRIPLSFSLVQLSSLVDPALPPLPALSVAPLAGPATPLKRPPLPAAHPEGG